MYDPPHPGLLLKEDYLLPLELTVTKAAEGLGITRKTLSTILNGHAGISPEMSLRLSEAFDTTPEFWLNLQREFDLFQARKRSPNVKVKRLVKY